MDNTTFEESNESTKDPKININWRVRESLRNKFKEKMNQNNMQADEFFSEMFIAYLKEEATSSGQVDFSKDINELNDVINRTSTIFKNMIEKSYMQISINKESFATEIEEVKRNLQDDYDKKISALQKLCDKTQKEYNLISEQAEGLLKDSKVREERLTLLEEAHKKDLELIQTYKEQIEILKNENLHLKEQAKNSIDSSLLEKAELKLEKALLEKDRYYQGVISSLQENYSSLQEKYTNIIELKTNNNPKLSS